MSHKKVTSKRATFTKSEREYVKGIVHNLSLQRLSDGESGYMTKNRSIYIQVQFLK